MSENKLSETGKNGVYVAGDNNYLFNFEDMAKTTSGAGYSKTYGSVVQGKRMQVSLRLKPRGSGSRLHTHKNEQFNWIVKGTLRVKIGDGAESFASAGTLIYVPANVPHTMIATADEDVLYFVCKDMSDLIYGKAVDGIDSGPHYDPGLQPVRNAD